MVADALSEIGIEVTADLPDWATRIERSNTGDYDMIVCGTIGKILDMDWASIFYQSGEVRMDASPYFADDRDRPGCCMRAAPPWTRMRATRSISSSVSGPWSCLPWCSSLPGAGLRVRQLCGELRLPLRRSEPAGRHLPGAGRSERALTVHFSKSDATDAIGIRGICEKAESGGVLCANWRPGTREGD